jgi:hypothetical protein
MVTSLAAFPPALPLLRFLPSPLCPGGAALLAAHYRRRHPGDAAAAQAEQARLFEALRQRRLCLAFEMVRRGKQNQNVTLDGSQGV